MLYTVDMVNSMGVLPPPLKLGAYVLDDCDKDTYGLQQAVDFIKGNNNNQSLTVYFQVAITGLFCLFSIFFKNNITNLSTMSIQYTCWDSNTWPSQHKSAPITSSEGLPPIANYLWPLVYVQPMPFLLQGHLNNFVLLVIKMTIQLISSLNGLNRL